ncbi:MAG: NUDIX domain-containing protein [Bacteroidales bacterium]
MSYTYKYPRMLVTVDAVIFLKDDDSTYKILLIKRKNPPFQGRYALPGGFPETDELLKNAAIRELQEETGLKMNELEQLAAFDKVNRDPRDRNISIAYYGLTTPQNAKLNAGDDAAEAHWIPLKNLPELAFDHQEIIELAAKRLQIKL